MEPAKSFARNINIMEQTLNEILKELTIIKWGVVCFAFSLWGIAVFFLFNEIPKWWKSFDKEKKKEKKPFTLEQMNKDLRGSTRPRKDSWDG